MSAELALAAISAADLCLKYGKKLVKLYRDFKNSDDYVREKHLLVESILSRIALQVDFVKRVASTLGEDHCRVQFEAFEILQSKLTIAITKLESVVRNSLDKGVKKFKLPFVRDSLDEVLWELERWQRIFDPTWFLILRISDKLIDAELNELEGSTLWSPTEPSTSGTSSTLSKAQSFRSVVRGSNAKVHVSLPQDGLDWENATAVPFSTTRLIPRARGSSKQFLVDSIVCDSNLDIPSARADAEDLAKKLSQADAPTFGLLSCHGLVKRKQPPTAPQITSLDLVFRMPKADPPVTLRQHLMRPQAFSLTAILDLSRQLARAVSFVHACDFVHKNIRPETIMLFQAPGRKLGSAHLLGFDSFRSINFHTLLLGDATWERNLYRHPSRQGLRARDKYSMQHDVYSLGVCLLEIGLWASFVGYEAAGEATPGEALGLSVDGFKPSDPAAASSVKDHLVELAESRLPMRMGDKYASVVVTCLACLDEGNPDFGESEMQDEDGVLVGVKFIEKVLFRLSEISL
ncbi:hypothetical protein ACJ41O_008783 [Fusarium nematophilum]